MRGLKLAAAALVICAGAFTAQAQQTTPAQITAIRAHLFFEETARFSEDVIANRTELFNTIIGEGGAGGASRNTLVTVEVRGANLPVGGTRVEVVARAGSRVLARRTLDVEIYDEARTFHAPVWLYGTGCEAIQITARLIGPGVSAAPVTRRVEFTCGE